VAEETKQQPEETEDTVKHESRPSGQSSEEKPKQAEAVTGGKLMKRLDRVTRNWRTAEAENTQLKAQVEALQQQLASGAPSDAASQAAIEKRAAELSLHREREGKLKDWQRRFAEQVQQEPDPAKVAESVKNTMIPNGIVHILVEHPEGHRIALHLAKNPEISQSLMAMPVHLAAAKLGEIAHEISKPAAKPERFQSKAPRPVGHVSGGSLSTVSPDQLDYRDYANWRAKGGR
jgi:hypothetical protein